jgi:hypothetical protein
MSRSPDAESLQQGNQSQTRPARLGRRDSGSYGHCAGAKLPLPDKKIGAIGGDVAVPQAPAQPPRQLEGAFQPTIALGVGGGY